MRAFGRRSRSGVRGASTCAHGCSGQVSLRRSLRGPVFARLQLVRVDLSVPRLTTDGRRSAGHYAPSKPALEIHRVYVAATRRRPLARKGMP